ncbi:hypothetical protein AB2E30_10225 [Escherichia coli]
MLTFLFTQVIGTTTVVVINDIPGCKFTTECPSSTGSRIVSAQLCGKCTPDCVSHQVCFPVIAGGLFYKLCHCRIQTARQYLPRVPCIQSAQHARDGLYHHLRRTARTVAFHDLSVFRSLPQLCIAHARMLFPGCFHRFSFAIRHYDITHLTANLADNLRFLQTLLFFLLVKYRCNAAVGVFRVPAEPGNILLLTLLITDNEISAADGG